MGDSDFCQLADPEVAVTSEDIQARRSVITAAMAPSGQDRSREHAGRIARQAAECASVATV
jgi:hypothetical protein